MSSEVADAVDEVCRRWRYVGNGEVVERGETEGSRLRAKSFRGVGGLVPRDVEENIEFRDRLRDFARRADGRKLLWSLCRADPLFWINAFVWIFEPRPSRQAARVIPFVTYPFQDESLLEMNESLGYEDIGIEKSRDQGASWMVLVLFTWRFVFFDHQSFMLISRTQELVDKKGNMDALMPKIDHVLKHLPSWMRPRVDRVEKHMENLENGSKIDGESTTGNVGRGGRRLAQLLDEYAAFDINDGYRALAATQAVCDSRVFLSTPQGSAGAFYDRMHADRLAMRRLRLHWSDHPFQGRGLYRSKDGILEVLDRGYEFPKDYEFIIDGRVHSPWYDHECLRCEVPSLIAQELDIDYGGSLALFFDRSLLNRVIRQDSRPPYEVGMLKYDRKTGDPDQFVTSEDGWLRLWCHPDARGELPRDRRYVVGADIAMGSVQEKSGTGASNSAATVMDTKTGEKVAELAVQGVIPVKFAGMVAALARWFKGVDGLDAYLIWEDNGPGQQFRNEIIRLGFRNYYCRDKKREHPGWWTTADNKGQLLGEYQRALDSGEFVNRSERALIECESYVVMPDGRIEHVASISRVDPTAARSNHGDRTIADALCWWAAREKQRFSDSDVQREGERVPPGSFLERQLARRAAEREERYVY